MCSFYCVKNIRTLVIYKYFSKCNLPLSCFNIFFGGEGSVNTFLKSLMISLQNLEYVNCIPYRGVKSLKKKKKGYPR